MNTTVKYFKYRFLRSLVILPFAIIAAFLLSSVTVYRGWFGTGTAYLNLSTIVPFVSFYSMLIPVYELYPFNNKRNLDLWFSFPIKRQGIMGVHYASGLINVFVANLFLNACILVRMMSYGNAFYIGEFLNTIPWSLIYAISIYSISFFAFTLSNNNFDGCVYVFLYHFIFGVLASAIDYFATCVSGVHLKESITSCFSQDNLIERILLYYQYLSYREDPYDSTFIARLPLSVLISLVVWFVISIALVALTIYFSDRRDSSKVGGVSDNVFGYQVLIPAWVFAFILESIENHFSSAIGYAILLAVAFTVYRRGFKYKKQDYITFGVLVALCIVLSILGEVFDWRYVYY